MSGDPANDSSAVQGLLREALDEEEQRLNTLEERVKRLTERRTRGQLKKRLIAGDDKGRNHTLRVPLEIPPPGTLAEMLEDVEEEAGSSLADLVEQEEPDEAKEEAEARRRAFAGPSPELLNDALAALEAPKPRGFRDDDESNEFEGFREPVQALPAEALEPPRPRSFADEPEDFREPVLALPPDILEPPRPRGFEDRTEADLVIAGLEVQDAVVDEDAAEDLYLSDGDPLAIPEDDQSSADGAPLPMPEAAQAEPPRFAELSLDAVNPSVAEHDDGDDAETEAARRLIEETGQQLRDLERQLMERRAPAPAAVVAPALSAPGVEEPEHSPAKFGLNRAFGSASADLSRVLDGQKRLLDQVEALSSEIEDIREIGAGPPTEETQALNTRVEHAEAAAAEAWRHVAEATGRTEKLVELVERIVERVGRLEDRPAPAVSVAPAVAPPPAAPAPTPPPVAAANLDPGATQHLIRLLQSGQMPRRDFTLSGVIPRLESSGVTSRSRDLLVATVKEHHELLKDQGRLLERLIKLEERT